ncbi:MAG: STAS/SEC14 domain-containing protein [Candidatus Sungbacteria bacterium]|nr:STAS/SEC14 domain-containing protein [Candidatus Sungbacteria bacterium]
MESKKMPEFTVEAGKDGIIHLALKGHIGSEHLTGLSVWAEEVKRVVRREHEKGEKVLVVTDISKLENYHPEALSTLAELLKANEPYIERSATFGGSQFIIIAQDIIRALSGRTNFRGFQTEAEALQWLKEQGR